ncbi:MAG: hypothetical protein KDC10_01940, partial [Calditrichaeota bacterium]|nr:hypothetical protein [Calditrichota bacterium]
MKQARPIGVLALALMLGSLAHASGLSPAEQADKDAALRASGQTLSAAELAEKVADQAAARLKAKTVETTPATTPTATLVSAPGLDASQLPTPLSTREQQEKLDADQAFSLEDRIQWKLAHGGDFTPVEKQWLEDQAAEISHKGPSHGTDEGGPDAWGNTWIMTGDEGGPAYAWVDIPEVDRNYLTLTDDSFVGPLDMGGTLSFYGVDYSEIYVGSNGNVGFLGTSLNNLGNVAIPSLANPNALLSLFWDDMNPATGGQVYTGTVDGDFVITYDAVNEYSSGPGTLTAQIVIDFDGPAVYFNYEALANGIDQTSCTIGIENETGTDGLQLAYNNAAQVPANQTTVRFDLAPPPDYLIFLDTSALGFNGGPSDEIAGSVTITNGGNLADSYDLSLSAPGVVAWGTFVNGNPVSTIGPLDPGASTTVDVVGTIDENAPTGTDNATLTFESVNSDATASVALNTAIFNGAAGGPDAFGNTWVSSAGGDQEYFWVDIPEEDRTYVTLTDDSFAGPFDMGAVISYYGDPYTELYIGSNGNLAFTSTSLNSLGNVAIPNATAPNNIMPLFWDDMNPASGGQVYCGTVDGRFVVTYDAVSEYSGTGTLTAQVVYDFAESQIFYNYEALTAPLDITSCTIGIENATGTDGLQVIYNNTPAAPLEQWTLRFDLAPPPDYAVGVSPLTINTTGGPAGNLLEEFTITNAGLLPDSYDLNISFEDLVDWTIQLNGSPVGNTGVLQPLESITIQLAGLVDAEAPTIIDASQVSIESVNSDVSYLLPVSTSIFNAAAGGPDAYGNAWVSSAGGDQQYFWVDVEDATPVTLASNSVAGPFPLNGVLSYYGEAQTQFYIGSNGMIGFSNVGMTSTVNQNLPSATTPSGLIALFWDDMNPGGGGTVSYGNDVDGRMVVTYADVPETGGVGLLTAQVVIDFATQQVFCNYASLDGLDLSSCTIGIENSTGTDGLTVIYNGTPAQPLANWTIRFDLAPPPDFQMEFTGPTLIQASSNNVVAGTFTLSNSGLASDSYDLTLSGGSLFTYAIQDMEGNVITSVGPLAPLTLEQIQLVVTVPADMGGQSETVSLTATSQADDNTFITLNPTVNVIATSGSDSFGNEWYSNLDPDGTDFFFVELDPQDRTAVTLTDDSSAGPFDMGASINFYGVPQNQIYIGSNGMVGFAAAGMTTLANQNMPSTTAPNGVIALFWDDLNPGTGGQVYYGTSTEGYFVITYDGVFEYSGTGTFRAQVVFDFENDFIFLNYDQFNAPIDLTSCTIGIENYDGTDAAQVVYNNAPWTPFEEMTLRFELPPPPDFWPSLEDGVTAVGAADSEVSVPMDISNIGLLQDAYVLSASADNGIEVDILINGNPGNQTPVIQPEASFTFDLVLTIPEVPGGANSTITVNAVSVGDASRTDQTTALLTIVLVQGGPDGGGYFWSTTDADGVVEYDWVTIDNPTTATLTDDSSAGPFEIGFPWTHYGMEYTQVYIASNGSIGFDPTGLNSLANQQLPNVATPNGVISFFWDDLNPATAGGTVSYGSQDGMFIVTFDQVFEFGGQGRITAQVILDSNEEAVRINYQTLAAPLDILSCTIGQEDAGGNQGFSACYNGQGWLPHDNASIWFGFNVIGPSGPYAVRVRPDNLQGVGITGGYAEYELEVENRGENPSAFTLETEGNVWDVTFHDIDDDWAEITEVPEMAFDTVFNLGVRVHVPEEPASFTDLVHLTVVSTEDETASDDAQILTASSCSHTAQLHQNINGNGLFGMEHLMDGDWVEGETIASLGTNVNRMV